jgi:hypothetical protein
MNISIDAEKHLMKFSIHLALKTQQIRIERVYLNKGEAIYYKLQLT